MRIRNVCEKSLLYDFVFSIFLVARYAHITSYYALLLLLLLLLHYFFIVFLKVIYLFGYPAASV